MKIIIAAVAVMAAFSAAPAMAGSQINFGFYSPAPTYYTPPVVYYPPVHQAYFAPPRAYCPPRFVRVHRFGHYHEYADYGRRGRGHHENYRD